MEKLNLAHLAAVAISVLHRRGGGVAVVEVERCSVEIGRTPEGRRICCEARIEVLGYDGRIVRCWAGHGWWAETFFGQPVLHRIEASDSPAIAVRAMP